jgi:hypothetical protein
VRCALIVAVETTQITAFGDQPGLVAGAVAYVRWLVDPEGGGLSPSGIRMLCSTAGAKSQQQLDALLEQYPDIQLDGPPTEQSLKAAVAGFGESAGLDDVVLYWAGHGVSDGGAGPGSQSLALANENRIPLYNLLSWLVEKLQPNRVLGVVDACRVSAADHDVTTLGDPHRLPVKKVWEAQPELRQLFYACGQDERAYATEEEGGDFTVELLEQLKATGPSQPGLGPWLPAQRWNLIHERLVLWGEQVGQHPYISVIDNGGDRSFQPTAVSGTPRGLSDAAWDELRARARAGGAVPTRALLLAYNEIRPPAAEPDALFGRSGLGDYLDELAALGGNTASGAQLPVLRFLYTLAHGSPGGANLDPQLLAWLESEVWWGYEQDLKAAFEARQAELARERNEGTYLVLELQPPRAPAAPREQLPRVRTFRCRLTLFRGGDPHPLAAPQQPLPLRNGVSSGAAESGEHADIAHWFTDTLEEIVSARRVELAEPAGAYLPLDPDELEGLTVEFVVPRELLGAGFGKWKTADGPELRSAFPVQLRDNGYDRTRRTERARRRRSANLALTGGKLTERDTGWVVCDNRNGSVAMDDRIQDYPYVMFTFPAVDEDGDGRLWMESTPFARLLNLGVPAVLWPDRGCKINHAEWWTDDLAADEELMERCSTIRMPAAYPDLLKLKRDLRPRVFVRDVNRDMPEHFAGLNLFYDDGTRMEARLVAP